MSTIDEVDLEAITRPHNPGCAFMTDRRTRYFKSEWFMSASFEEIERVNVVYSLLHGNGTMVSHLTRRGVAYEAITYPPNVPLSSVYPQRILRIVGHPQVFEVYFNDPEYGFQVLGKMNRQWHFRKRWDSLDFLLKHCFKLDGTPRLYE